MIKAGQQRCRERAHVTPAANAARLPGNGPRRASRAAALSARRAAVTLGLAGLLLGGATVASAPPAPAAFAAGHGTGWRIVPSPNGGRINNTLVQASAGPGTRAWAVGYDGAVGNLRTLIQRWSGTRWAVVASPSPSKLDNVLSGVATLSATSAWAVGYTSVSVPPRSYHRALIEHWNGRAWQVVPSPQAGTSDSDLWGVTALSATNAWAVGNQNIGVFQFRPLVEHWTGSTWQLVRVPSPPLTGVGASLLGVAATSPRNIWAVGDYADGKRFQPLIEHFNGTRWALIPAPAAGTAELNRISFMAPSNGWAVGSSGGGSHTQALIEHWNGHHWTIARTPAIPGSTNLADVLALTPHLAGPSAATPHPTAVAAPSSNDGTAGPGPSPPAPTPTRQPTAGHRRHPTAPLGGRRHLHQHPDPPPLATPTCQNSCRGQGRPQRTRAGPRARCGIPAAGPMRTDNEVTRRRDRTQRD